VKKHAKRRRKRTSGQANELPFFNFYPGDWLASGTRAVFTPEQRGAFFDLLCHEWMQPDCMLPTDEAVLAAYSGLGDRFAAVGRTVVERAFNKKGERLFNKRLMEMRRIAEGRVRQAVIAGKRSGEVRAKAKKKP
jgi:uncharacterized protein YdaU (DUF1376 family)